jgi:YggT family protein
VIRMLFDAYSLLVLVAVILSWTRAAPDNPIRKITDATVEPVLEPIRRVIPPIAGLDVSPLILLLGLRLLRSLLLGGL